MNKDNIPKQLHHLIDLVNRWGISDDGYRDEQIERASTAELEKLVSSIDKENLKDLNDWLTDESQMMKSTDEYINYTCFYMAYEYAEAVLKSRNRLH
ncbi:MAG TPA: hypothetical protein VIM75_04840 [Ohtaekwangia sp.]|uniref:hypothetical protein n=1 Tax=Ohtaekwangia sp. TaxID=2066019 RepID=UPI002F926BA6